MIPEFSYKTILSDLDYNKHTNGSIYEKYAVDARYSYLQGEGLLIADLIQENLDLVRHSAHLQFKAQQNWKSHLVVQTKASLYPNQLIHWHQRLIEQNKNREACTIDTWESYSHFPDVIQKNLDGILSKFKTAIQLNPETEFSNQSFSKRVCFYHKTNRSDRDAFQNLPWFQAFKVIEESRWLFSEYFHLGLESAIAMDCVFFTTESHYNVKKQMIAGERLEIEVFISDHN